MEEREYSARDIEVLEGIEHVRRRPKMYLGCVSGDALHELVAVLLGNIVDEAIEGHGRLATVTLASDGSIRTEDDGRGVSVETHERIGKSILELVFTKLGACYCGCEKRPGHRHSGFGHVNLAVVTALSEWLEVETSRDGRRSRMSFERGRRVGELEDLGPTATRGTCIRFLPDRSIFEPDAALNRIRLEEEMHGLTALVPGFELRLVDERCAPSSSTTFQCARGLADLVQALCEAPRLAHPFTASSLEDWPEARRASAREKAEVRLALQVDASDRERVVGFANLSRVDAGTHVKGLLLGLKRGFKDAARELGLPEPVRRPRGLRVAVAICFQDLWLEGTSPRRLGAPEAKDVVRRVARRAVLGWAKEHGAEVCDLLSR